MQRKACGVLSGIADEYPHLLLRGHRKRTTLTSRSRAATRAAVGINCEARLIFGCKVADFARQPEMGMAALSLKETSIERGDALFHVGAIPLAPLAPA